MGTFRAALPHSGQVFALFVIVLAAAEIGVGLAIVLQLYRVRASVTVDDVPLTEAPAPAAGLSAVEVGWLTEFLRTLPRAVAVLLVEHRLDLVYALCDTVTVLRDGRTLATGTPAQIRASGPVREAYAEGVA
ncbi:hypothetical protein GCM10027452_46470 [Micromonospora halotolerans]